VRMQDAPARRAEYERDEARARGRAGAQAV
jgi:hypothetical protein